MSGRCRTASVKPLSPKFMSSRLNVVTIATSPKSSGVSRRAMKTVATICTANPAPCESTVMPAPRSASLRMPSPPAGGRKAPVSSKGFTGPHHGDREQEDDPDRMHDLERGFRQVVEQGHHEERQLQPAQLRLPPQRREDVTVAPGDDDAEQYQAEKSQRQENLEVAVVRLVRVPPVRSPQRHCPLSEPEALEAAAHPRIDGHREQVLPQLGAGGERGVASHRAHHVSLRVEEETEQAQAHDAARDCVHGGPAE